MIGQPHQLQPLLDFNVWILASEAREAETTSPTFPNPPSSVLLDSAGARSELGMGSKGVQDSETRLKWKMTEGWVQ